MDAPLPCQNGSAAKLDYEYSYWYFTTSLLLYVLSRLVCHDRYIVRAHSPPLQPPQRPTVEQQHVPNVSENIKRYLHVTYLRGWWRMEVAVPGWLGVWHGPSRGGEWWADDGALEH